jgi:hypothetical protein
VVGDVHGGGQRGRGREPQQTAYAQALPQHLGTPTLRSKMAASHKWQLAGAR